MRLRGHFDGQRVVLDQPAPVGLKPNTPVDIVLLDEREQALREMELFLADLWMRPLPSAGTPGVRRWKREELYERGGKGLS
jgi:hypothetical protein